jgi:hypothetical protein
VDTGKRRAFYVIGPESSGTRMLAKAFIRSGVFGDASHTQRMDFLDFAGRPDEIMFRNSIPHAHVMMPIADITKKMEACGYEVVHVLIDRDDKYLLLSKVKRGHRPDIEVAKENLPLERAHIEEQIKELGVEPIRVKYEDFVGSAELRRELFESLSLPEPNMYFFNANETYK